MLRKESEAVPEGNGPVPQQVGSGQPTLEDEYWRKIEELLKRLGEASKEIKEDLRSMNQCVARLEHDARQSRLAMMADGQAKTKTRECTEGAVKAVQAKHEDSCTVQRFQDGPKTSTCFGVMAKPPDFPCREDVLAENGAAAPKSCLPSLEMRTTTAAGGLLPTSEISTATKTTFNQPPLRVSTEETNCKKTSTPYVSHDSSFFQKNNLHAASSCRRVIETKSGENRTFDSGSSLGRLRACPFLRSWRALLCGEVMHVGAAG